MGKLKIHRWDQPETASPEVFEESTNNADKLFETLNEGCLMLNEPRLKWQKIGVRTVYSYKEAGILTPYKLISALLCGGVVVASILATMRGAPPDIQACMYMTGAGLSVFADPLHAFRKILAPQTRFLLFLDSLVLSAVAITKDIRTVLAMVLVLGVSGLLIRLMNGQWLHSYNWLASESVRRAVAKNPEAKGYKVWEDYGKREARVTLSENGLKFDDSILDSYGMVLFLHGFYSGYQKNVKLKKRAETVQENIDDMLYQVEMLQGKEADYQNRINDLENENSRLKYLARKCAELEEENKHLQGEIESMEQRNNVEPVVLASEELEEEPEETIEGKIVSMLKAGESIRKTAKACNVSDYQVNKIRQSIKGELTA